MQKQGDSMLSTQTNFSVYDSTGVNSIAANKENLPAARNSRMSYALLDGESTSNSICPNMESTALHRLSGENLGSDSVVEELFQVQNLEAHCFQQPKLAEIACTTNLNQTAMEVSMMWQDIMSQTKEAGVINKTSSRMGNTINLVKESESNSRAPLAARQTIYYNGQMEGEMEIEKTVQQNTIYYQTANDDMDESVFKIPPGTSAQQRSIHHNPEAGHGTTTTDLVVAKHRQTIHFNDENGELEESVLPQMGLANGHQTIHFHTDGSAMEESVLEVTKFTATRGRDSYFPGGSSDHPRENPLTKRQTIHYPEDGDAMDETVRDVQQRSEISEKEHQMEESVVVDQRLTLGKKSRESCFIAPENKENLTETHRITRGMASKIRQTIHYQAEDANMDESHRQATNDLPRIVASKPSRQTIIFKESNAAMDESMAHGPNIEYSAPANVQLTQETLPQKSNRQSIHFNGNEGMMEESVRYPIQPTMKNTRQSIHFNEVNNGMDESVQIKVPVAQDILIGRGEDLRQRKMNPRSTICFQAEEGHMDESVNPPKILSNPRQTIHFRPDEAAMDESVNRMTVVTQVNSARQTINFNATAGAMEESRRVSPVPHHTIYNAEQMDVDENILQKIATRRETVYYQAQDGNMDESHVVGQQFIPKPVLPMDKVQKNVGRQTVYYQDENGGLDETKLGSEKERQEVQRPMNLKSRQTIYDERQMDVSVADYERNKTLHVPIEVQKGSARNQRQTIYYNDAELDVTGAPQIQQQPNDQAHNDQLSLPPTRRGTIYDQTGMEESIIVPARDKSVIQALPVQSAVLPKDRQTIYFNQADDAGMDETIAVLEMEKPMGPLQRSMRLQSGNKSIAGIQGPLERSVMMQQSQRIEAQANVDEESFKSPAAKQRKTIYYQQDDGMEESMQVPHIQMERTMQQVTGAEPKELKRPRETIYTAATMEESMRGPPIRRGTFNVPKEDSVMLGKFMPSSTMKNSTAFDIPEDSMVSDLNNLDDSIELMDSYGKGCPVNSSKYVPRASHSPNLVNETVNDLNLNFNVTGLIIPPKQKTEEQPISKPLSKIPVRTPSKQKKSMAKCDMSAVDVPRDASVIVPRSRFQEEELRQDHTIVDAIKAPRMSIPVLSVNNVDATMEPQAFGEIVEEEDVPKAIDPPTTTKSCRGILEYRVDVEKFKSLDFGAAVDQLRDLNIKVHKVCNTILIDQTMYIPRLGTEVSLKQEIFEKAEE